MPTLRNPYGVIAGGDYDPSGYDPTSLGAMESAYGGGDYGNYGPPTQPPVSMPAPTPTAPPAPTPSPAAYTPKGPTMQLGVLNQQKFDDPNFIDPKYVFLRAAKGLGMGDTDELLRRLQADPSGYFANASFGGQKGDQLILGGNLDPKFKGIGQFDVIKAAGAGGKGWMWEPSGKWAKKTTGKPKLPSAGRQPLAVGGGGRLPGSPGGGGSLGNNTFRNDLYKQISDMIAAGGPTNSALQSGQSALQSLIDNGGKLDQSIIDSRMESAREGLDSTRRASLDQARAELASRGLMGSGDASGASGPEISAILRSNEDMQRNSASAFRGIQTEEAQAANTRYANAISQMTGLGTAQASSLINLLSQAGDLSNADQQALVQKLAIDANLSIAQAQNAFNYAKLAADQKLGMAQLGQQRYASDLNYSLGLGQLGLGRDRLSLDAQDPGLLAQILSILGNNAGNASGGYY